MQYHYHKCAGANCSAVIDNLSISPYCPACRKKYGVREVSAGNGIPSPPSINPAGGRYERIKDEVYFHIDRGEGETLPGVPTHQWNIGEVLEYGKQLNRQTWHEENASYICKSPDKTKVFFVNAVLQEFVSYTITGKKDPNFSFYDYDANNALVSLVRMGNKSLETIRELIFEQIRQERFPSLPSRRTCLWVIEDAKEALSFWINALGYDGQQGFVRGRMVKLQLTGKMFRGYVDYQGTATCGLNEWRQRALYFWSQTPPFHPERRQTEIMFEGTAKVLAVAPLEEFARSRGIELAPRLSIRPEDSQQAARMKPAG